MEKSKYEKVVNILARYVDIPQHEKVVNILARYLQSIVLNLVEEDKVESATDIQEYVDAYLINLNTEIEKKLKEFLKERFNHEKN